MSIVRNIVIIYVCLINSALAETNKWSNYINQSVGAPLYYLHESALYLFPTQCPNCRAFSFGSGPGNEEIDLVKKGWVVTSNDPYVAISLSFTEVIILSVSSDNFARSP